MITMMTTKDNDKGDEQKAQRSKNNSRESKNIHLKRIKNKSKSSRMKKNSRLKKKAYKQESRFKISRIKIKIQDSRFKNEEKTQSR